MKTSIVVRAFVSLLLCLLVGMKASAHPGSGIVVDKEGNIYFTDTGMGVWKIDKEGKLTFMPASKFHWIALDEVGYFAESQKNFGESFERVTPQSSKPVLIMCAHFPLTFNRDGNIYYANARHNSAQIIRVTPDEKESILARDKIFEFTSGIAAGMDGSLYITEASNPNANTIRKITMRGKVSTIATFVGKGGNDLPS